MRSATVTTPTATGPGYVLFGNGAVAAGFLEAVSQQALETPTGTRLPGLIVLNAPERQKEVERIRGVAERHAIEVVEWGGPEEGDLRGRLEAWPGVWILSVYFGHILSDRLLDAVDGRAVNLHASLLPWGRGADTNIWAILEDSPAGVSLHAMVPEVDAGPVLIQRQVPCGPADTAGSLYARLQAAGMELLLDAWPQGVLEAWPGQPQDLASGSYHVTREFWEAKEIELETRGPAWELFSQLRAFSFPPYGGLRIRVDGRLVEARLELKELDVDE